MSTIRNSSCGASRTRAALSASLLLLLACATPSYAADMAKPAGLEAIGLPQYTPPESFSEELVVTSQGKTIVMKRFVDKGKVRTDISVEGMEMVMIEMGDAKGTTYQLMPKEKQAIKQSRQTVEEAIGGKAPKKLEGAKEEQPGPTPADFKVEDLGDVALDEKPAKKLRMTTAEGSVLGWFDKTTGAPLRMEGEVDGQKAEMEWKNRKIEPQPGALYGVPKGYEVHDLDEMMAQMKAMGGMSGMVKGMMGGMGQGMGSSIGGSLGSSIGGSLAGPMGAVAGQYLGSKIGGLLGKKAATAVH